MKKQKIPGWIIEVPENLRQDYPHRFQNAVTSFSETEDGAWSLACGLWGDYLATNRELDLRRKGYKAAKVLIVIKPRC